MGALARVNPRRLRLISRALPSHASKTLRIVTVPLRVTSFAVATIEAAALGQFVSTIRAGLVRAHVG